MSRCIKAYVDVVMMEEPSLLEILSNYFRNLLNIK